AKSIVSTARTIAPYDDSSPRPIGATGIGRQGAKYRVGSKGQSSALPRPPSVSVSRSPWLASVATARAASPAAETFLGRAAAAIATPSTAANASECVAPRCPHAAPYGTPRKNPTRSASGRSARPDHTAADHHDGRRLPYTRAAATPTATCPTVAIAV